MKKLSNYSCMPIYKYKVWSRVCIMSLSSHFPFQVLGLLVPCRWFDAVPVWLRVMILDGFKVTGLFISLGITFISHRFLCMCPVGVSTIYDRGVLAEDTTLPEVPPESDLIHMLTWSGIDGSMRTPWWLS